MIFISTLYRNIFQALGVTGGRKCGDVPYYNVMYITVVISSRKNTIIILSK